MKLVAPSILFLSKFAFSSENKYTSTCNDQGQLEIHIPYANAAVAELLNADAGDCSALRGPGGGDGDRHEYSHDEANQKSILKINIKDCGLDKILEDDPILRTGEYYMATANVTIGITEDVTERDLIFYNAVLGSECGAKTDYTVSFDYSQKIDTHEETECHEKSPDGQCIVPAFEEYDFTFKEYDEAYENEITSASHKANEMIHLQIESSNLPDNKVFSVKQCTFVDKIVDENGDESFERYSMFDATTDCKNDYIDLSVGFREENVQIEHRLFLLTRGDHDSYSLECDIKVCDKDDDSSDCAEWKNTCEGGGSRISSCNVNDYVFDADDVVVGKHKESYDDLVQLPYSFVGSNDGAAILNKYASDHSHYFGFRTHTATCIFCTSDNLHIASSKSDPKNDVIYTPSKSDGSWRSCNEEINYRPKICSWPQEDDVDCTQDWSLAMNYAHTQTSSRYQEDYCEHGQTHALFMKTELYNDFVAVCDFTAVRSSPVFERNGEIDSEMTFPNAANP